MDADVDPQGAELPAGGRLARQSRSIPPSARRVARIDGAARRSRGLYEGLSASSAGLELGIAVAIGALSGSWMDGKLGTEPWMLLVGLAIGLVAGFRGVLRAVARADRAERARAAEAAEIAEAAEVSAGAREVSGRPRSEPRG